eukprot:577856-Hanusia_phi.AAC.1
MSLPPFLLPLPQTHQFSLLPPPVMSYKTALDDTPLTDQAAQASPTRSGRTDSSTCNGGRIAQGACSSAPLCPCRALTLVNSYPRRSQDVGARLADTA